MNAKQEEWSNYFDEEWLARAKEAPIDPATPIVDPHHHLMTWPFNYQIEAWVNELKNSGHNIVATVHTEAHGHYRTDGPEHTRAAGETEFLVKAAETAAKIPGAPKVCLGITGGGDLTVGTAKVEELLDAHTAAGKGRFRGIRINMFWGFTQKGDMFPEAGWENTAERADLAEGLACLEKRGLVLELVNHHINLPVVAKLARKFPKLTIVSNHLATIMDRNPTQAPEAELLAVWRKGVDLIAAQPNVRMKLGGCTNAMISHSMPTMRAFNKRAKGAPSSQEIADAYRPQVSYAIEKLGPKRCMFESNFPIDKSFTSYGTLWNAFKRLAQPYSADEKTALLSGTAIDTYKLSL